PQTTRHRILGILSEDGYQVIFLDTPGIIRPTYALQGAMMTSASSAIQDADLVVFMIDATEPKMHGDADNEEEFKWLDGLDKPAYLVVNKVDLVDKLQLLPIIEFFARRFPFKEIFPISALKLDGTSELVEAMVRELPEHSPYYPLDIVSEHNQRFFVSEIIREKIFLKMREEIPYSTTVDIVEFKERETGKWFISAEIYVERDSQKRILIGKKGAMLREIGQLARREVEKFLEHPVFLDLHVKIRDRWRNDEKWLQRLGYTSKGGQP
ncbi:MAG: GTPase Era, partial [Bacteroidetes bacterium]|nr:GTPase Era [Bacteroidota bacterium]